METKDARKLPAAAQEDLRRRVVRAVVEQGMRQAEAVGTFGVSRTSVHSWVKTFRKQGGRALASRPRGRPKRSRLAGWQAATVVNLVTDRCPDQLRLPFALWTREAVGQLMARRFDVHVSVWTVGRYLKEWGLTPQKPLRRAYEQNPEAVAGWLAKEYPGIRRRAKAENAEIHWGDEMGMRSDHQAGRSYGLRGKTPVIPGTGKRFGCNMISTVTNLGKLAFMVFKERFTSAVMIKFLQRLIRHADRKVFLILDRHPVHLAAKVKRWVEQHGDAIALFYLPGYSPELNPDELLNQDVKTNAVGRQRPQNQTHMISQVRSYLWATQRRPGIVKNYFKQKDVAYAAA
jgi:transposase